MAGRQAPQNLPNAGHFYTNLTQPVDININFVVDSTNGNGLGTRSLKSNGYANAVYMHTSAPLAGSGNPNPPAGFALIQLAGNYARYIGGFSGFVSPVSGTPLTATVIHNPYIIVSLGTATLAQWQAVGVPQGLTPAVGMSFIATASATIGGSAAVEAPSVSGIVCMEVIGDPNVSLNNSNVSANGGAYIMVQMLSDTDAPAAPANGSVCGMTFRLDKSSSNVDGL